jgi:N-acetylmuramoyl-L-alanine amidase
MREIEEIIIHCSATRADMDYVDVDWVRKIHVEQRGWRDVGYHYFIKRDGVVEQGRPITQVGAHTKGHNSRSVGICYAGGLDSNHDPEDNRTPEQIESLQRLITELMEAIPSIEEVSGHNEYSTKACPCFDVKKWWNEC